MAWVVIGVARGGQSSGVGRAEMRSAVIVSRLGAIVDIIAQPTHITQWRYSVETLFTDEVKGA